MQLGNSGPMAVPSSQEDAISRVGHVGLSNQGNTCFMNGGLQAMISSRVLVSAILEAQKSKKDGPMVRAFLEFIRASCGSDVYKPGPLKEAAGRRNPRFRGFAQEDSFELIQTVLDGLEEETNLADKSMRNSVVDNTGLSFEASQKAFHDNHYKRLDTPIARCTYSEIVREITCQKCHRSQYSFEYTQMLLLDLPKDQRSEVTLEDLLCRKRTSEVEGYRCPVCKDCVTVTLTERLATPAECLIIVFKRYEEGSDSWSFGRSASRFRKNNISVNYPLELVLSIPATKPPVTQTDEKIESIDKTGEGGDSVETSYPEISKSEKGRDLPSSGNVPSMDEGLKYDGIASSGPELLAKAKGTGQDVAGARTYVYGFRGASIQSGGLCGGHYTAVGFGCDGHFYVCNDSHVTRQDTRSGGSKYQLPREAYVVIYDRVDKNE
ncbi:Ubiquitin carboxyl-terminal hydrolase 4 [Giardia muris]|uniref:Ubiquitin carboxyl-terminal hydrolase 4 n=1 Tax=Giardia muris TaxID=5742 RepID=A0A4Z1T4W2_GIAMU|nr:Ubiquitin carboxyl-terminal hydrolase 4 [Giardia muris]|eukprot:TNJ27481.1 Ubiquitin carboxyl-terminal hydrolase 4 [Giardia muris]